jgi:hypothetical protein
VIFLTVVGCATTEQAYRTTEEKNLRIEAKTERSSFGKVRSTFLYVYEVDRRCETNYLGYVRLDKPVIEIGLPTGKLLMLTADFVATARNRYSYLLQPQPGYDYVADILHREKLYKFTLMERSRGSGTKRVIEHKDLGSCVPR